MAREEAVKACRGPIRKDLIRCEKGLRFYKNHGNPLES